MMATNKVEQKPGCPTTMIVQILEVERMVSSKGLTDLRL